MSNENSAYKNQYTKSDQYKTGLKNNGGGELCNEENETSEHLL